MKKPALVTVDLVADTAAQSLARMIEPLLRVAHPVEQLAPERARGVIHVPAKIDNIGHNQFCRCARCGRAQICGEIADGKINLVTDRRYNWHGGIEYCSCHNLFVELP